MRSFVRFVNRLPLAGKLAIRPFIFSLYQSTTKKERRRRYLSVLILFGFLFCTHVYQAWSGFRVFSFNAPIWAKAIGGLYALVNASVVVAQVSLLIRATRFFWKGAFPRTKYRQCRLFSSSEALTMMVVTLGGQIVFGLTYFAYM